MTNILRRIYKILVRKNKYIYNDYILYKNKFRNCSKVKKFIQIIRLNIKYRILKKKPLIKKENKKEKELSRRPIQWFTQTTLLNYDIISFDVFDTLILRPFSKPESVFVLIGEKYGITDFVSIRKSMEKKARDINEQKTGSREVTLLDIYKLIEDYAGINANDGAKLEFEIELDICFANPYMKKVFEILRNCNKRIIAVTDMYLPLEYIELLVKKCGYDGFYKIIVSNEYGYSKRSGKLYELINKEFTEGLNVIHIGDNYQADVIKAKEAGWSSYYYKNVNNIGKPYRAKMSPFMGTAYSGVINAFLHNGINRGGFYNNEFYRFGFIYGGFFILGFANWIHDYAIKNNIDKILFFSRDGYIVKKVYDSLYSDIKSEYVFWSRNAALKAGSNKFRYDYLNQYILRRIRSNPEWTMSQVFESMDLDFMSQHMINEGIDPNTKLSNENVEETLIMFIKKYWSIIQKHNDNISEAAKNYYTPIINGCQSVCAIDTGWRGTGAHILKYLVEEKWQLQCKVTGLMAATYQKSNESNTASLLNNTLNTYLFSSLHNKSIQSFHRRNALINNTCVELFTSAPHPSLNSFLLDQTGGYKLIFEKPEIENKEAITMINEGILDFAKEYMNCFRNYPFMLNISGSDAYKPIFHVLNKDNFDEVKSIFNDFVYHQFVGGREHSAQTETFGDMCNRLNK